MSAPNVLQEEIATFAAKRAQLVESHADQFVLIKGQSIVGFFGTEIDAINVGHEKFGNEPFLVRKVADTEAPILLTSLNVSISR